MSETPTNGFLARTAVTAIAPVAWGTTHLPHRSTI